MNATPLRRAALGALVLALLFVIAWRFSPPPDPPAPARLAEKLPAPAH